MNVPWTDPARVCIVSGRFPPTEFLSAWNHRAYANVHGYTYVHCNWPTRAANRYMVKFHFVREYLPHFDYLFWIDDDAFIVDLNKPLDALAPQGEELVSFCKSPSNKKIFTYLSSGQFLLRGGPGGIEFVDAVIATSLETVENWWRDDLGMFTKGDQDAVVYLAHEDARFRDKIRLFDHRIFNSRLLDLREDPRSVFLLHFTGSREKKHADHTTAAQILGRGPSLLPPQIEGEFFDIKRAIRILQPPNLITRIRRALRKRAH